MRIDADVLTVVVDVHVAPGRQAEFVSGVTRLVEEFTRHQPGFLGSAIHASEDGTRMLNYSQWRDRASYEAFRDDPEAEARISELRALCEVMDAREMEVAAVIPGDGA
jgi:quinol monooxygenase YgiN